MNNSESNYCYPGTNVLVNKGDLRTKDALDYFESVATGTRLLELQKNPIQGKFDFDHLKAIHRYIFQDVYDWAGEIRTVDIGKGNLFCLVQHIPTFANDVFAEYYKKCKESADNKKEFIRQLTRNYSNLNACHPFREGNGRAQREFARELCADLGYDFDLRKTTHDQMLTASIKSFYGDSRALAKIFGKNVRQFDASKDIDKNANALKIFSIDDFER